MPDALPLYRVAQVRAIEAAALAAGLDAATLMQRAGVAVAAALRRHWPAAHRIGVLCGSGNNGGDGYVAARLLRESGLEVRLVAIEAPRTPEAIAAAMAWRDAGGSVLGAAAWPAVDVWIDALFGVGLSRPPQGEALAAILRLVEARADGCGVLAVDVPSGLDVDRGQPRGVAAVADLTVCLVAAKRGLLTAAAGDHVGHLDVDGLGVPPSCFHGEQPEALAVGHGAIRLPRRGADSHKGRHGRVLCVGGAPGMGGALVLCAEAAARAGAGWVDAAGSAEAITALRARRPEVLGAVLDAAHPLAPRMASATALALGPGLGRDHAARACFEEVLTGWSQARAGRFDGLVLDADGLGVLAGAPRPLPGAVLTPHPGEAARLLGSDSADIQGDRYAALHALVARHQCAVVLKGAGTLVGAPGQVPRLVRAGGPAMASAGMGDVLTGVIASLIAQGLPAFEAAWSGALAHALAADAAAGGRTRGLLAADLLPRLSEVLES